MAQSRKRRHLEDSMPVASTLTRSIKTFGRIQKPHCTAISSKRQKAVHEKDEAANVSIAAAMQVHCTHGKRKRIVEDSDPETQSQTTSKESCDKRIKLRPLRQERSKQVRSSSKPSTNGTTSLFNNLKLDPTDPSVFPPEKSSYRAALRDTQSQQLDVLEEVFEELRDLKALCTAFLSALSLFYAHNGSSSPAKAADLLPMVTAHWKRRACNLDDLRKVVILLNKKEKLFIFQDLGSLGIHLVQDPGTGSKHASTFVDEAKLKLSFDEALENEWAIWQRTNRSDVPGCMAFVARLQLEAITRGSGDDVPSRGKQLLGDLKANQAAARNATSNREPTTSVTTGADQTVMDRSASLLDRILAKQAHRAGLPIGPTKSQMERQAALQRIEDIVRVLDVLAAGRPRCSFGLQALTTQLQQSLRNPIAKDEALRCLELMANEITPGFVNVVKSGILTSIVVTRGGKVELGLLRARIQRALGLPQDS